MKMFKRGVSLVTLGVAATLLMLLGGTAGIVGVLAQGKDPDAAQYKTMDEKLREIGGEVPEFGGLHVVDDKFLEVLVTNLEKANKEQINKALERVLGSDLVNRYELRLAEAKYSMSQLIDWYEGMPGPILDISGVHRTGIHEGKNRLIVVVNDNETKAAVEQKLKELQVPLEAVIIEVKRGVPILLNHKTVQDRFDPLDASGVQIHSDPDAEGKIDQCTLGFITERDNVLGFVTNSHCTVQDFAHFFGRTARRNGLLALVTR